MTDTVKAWIEERRAARVPNSTLSVSDAHNNLPRALTALEQVLELHTESKWGFCTQCMNRGEHDWMQAVLWPCPTVQAVQTAIEGGR